MPNRLIVTIGFPFYARFDPHSFLKRLNKAFQESFRGSNSRLKCAKHLQFSNCHSKEESNMEERNSKNTQNRRGLN